MKFNEKLIELRKKEGLSQEELGYKLNVTRQTVSKWELGQTTPEMDKLVEMSKIFNISVDELINETEVAPNKKSAIEDQPIGEKNTKEKNIKIIIIGVLVVVLVLIIVRMVITFGVFNKVKDTQKNITGNAENIIDGAGSIINNVFDTLNNKIGGSQNNIVDQIEIDMFNNTLERYSGTRKGGMAISVLDKIITSNKTEDRKITVKYMETETQDTEEIKNIKYNIETFDDYEISFEYDENGFINEAIIEKL